MCNRLIAAKIPSAVQRRRSVSTEPIAGCAPFFHFCLARAGATQPRLRRAFQTAPIWCQSTRIHLGTHRAFIHALPSTVGLRFVPFSVPSVLSASAQVKYKNRSATAEKKKTMKLEEIRNKTSQAVSYLVAGLESGQSDILTQYLNAMARFHNYSFGNIVLIARRRAVTCCYASLESMNMRSGALWKQAMERSPFSEDNSVLFRIRSSLL